MAKKSVIQKELDRLKEQGMEVEINQVTPYLWTFKFNFEILKYHRHRVGRFGQYDPLHTYKKRVADLIIETMREKNLIIPDECWCAPFKITIECATVPTKGSGTKKSLLYKLLGLLPRSIFPDLDNLAKTPMDIMNGLIWEDDAQAHELTIRKVYKLEEYTAITVEFEPVDGSLTRGRLTPAEKEEHTKLLEAIDQVIWSTPTPEEER